MTPRPGAPLDAPRPRLPRVRVSPERIVRTIVGLRPFRASGFRVEVERLGDTLVVHNYGHGGCGVTLSWGTATLAVDLVGELGRHEPIAVIGCGAVGLATARLLQARGYEVTIHARELPPRTTSDVAAALWYPHLIADEARRTAAFDRQFECAARESHRQFERLLGGEYGVCWRPQYFLSHASVPDPWDVAMVKDLFPEPRQLRPAEHPFPHQYVVFSPILFIDPTVYLAALLHDFRRDGGHVRVHSLSSRADVAALSERIVMNCTGLGARELFDDKELTPIKGQLTVLAPQPEIDYAWVDDEDLYMFPRQDGILLGGTHERGEESLEANRDAERRILAGHQAAAETMKA
jgi:D-amino-acid oxidase